MSESLVVVTWRDAHSTMEDDGPHDDYLVRTVGWLLDDGPRFLRIACERTPDDWRGITHIPVENVITVQRQAPVP